MRSEQSMKNRAGFLQYREALVLLIISTLLLLLIAGGMSYGKGRKAVHPSSHSMFAYVLGDRVSQYKVRRNGTLTPVKGKELFVAKPLGIVIAPNKLFAYISSYNYDLDDMGPPFLRPFRIGPNGVLQQRDLKLDTNVAGASIAFTPSSKYAYVHNRRLISQYRVLPNSKLQALSPASVPSGGTGDMFSDPNDMFVHPKGHFAYSTDEQGNKIWQYRIQTKGRLQPLTPATISAGRNPTVLTFATSGRFAYVLNTGDNSISQYRVADNGVLRPLMPPVIRTGSTPFSIVITPSGRFAYIVKGTSENRSRFISQYRIGSNGTLQPLAPSIPIGKYSTVVTIAPSGRFAYISTDLSEIRQYRITQNGVLKPLSPPSIRAKGAIGVTIDPTGRFAYVPNTSYDTVTQCRIKSDGVLSPLNPSKVYAGIKPFLVTIVSR